ncbi:MAG: prolyl oligopeptidase family serine peptidase [Lachnospiraceae bacterium]|nr:prolyl oligopeptidase family serine peptidase [Lachnospiraceae bacterium]
MLGCICSSCLRSRTHQFVVAYGPNDKIVPVNLKYDLLDALRVNGVDYSYIEFPNSGHAMAFDPDKTKEYLDTVNAYLENYMN